MTTILIALVVPAVLLALGVHRGRRVHRIGEWQVVQYGLLFRVLAWTLTTAACAAAVGSLFLAPVDRIYMLLVSAIFAVPAGILLTLSRTTKICFNEEGMRISRPFRDPVFVSWGHVKNVAARASGEFVLELQNQEMISLHPYMTGVASLVEQMQRLGVKGALLSQATKPR